jgi:predicted RecB family nuclease
MKITVELFEAFLRCPMKCWLRDAGEPASGNAYAEWTKTQNESYRMTETERLIRSPNGEVAASPVSESLKSAKWRLATSLTVRCETNQGALEVGIHAVERDSRKGSDKAAQFIPVRFIFTNKLGRDAKLLVAFDALVLSEALGREVEIGKIIHGENRATLSLKTGTLTGEVRKRIEEITVMLSNETPPDVILNRHCPECEFRDRCWRKAIDTDDLSLLAGMSAKERQKLRSKGIFTVTQLSYTFRPRRRPKRLAGKREKYYHSLKALAIREKKIHVVGRPELNIEGTPAYLDVEGLPDSDFYYLIGLRIGNGNSAVQHSLWADSVEDEAKIWWEFLTILESIKKPVLIHYGSYERTFFKKLSERHGSPRQDSVAMRAVDSATNLLSVVFAQIYFPTYSNGLKEIAGCVGFKWPDSKQSGIQTIVSRCNWEVSCDPALKTGLTAYNTQDCEALERICSIIRASVNTARRTTAESQSILKL